MDIGWHGERAAEPPAGTLAESGLQLEQSDLLRNLSFRKGHFGEIMSGCIAKGVLTALNGIEPGQPG